MPSPHTLVQQSIRLPRNIRSEDVDAFSGSWDYTFKEPEFQLFRHVRYNGQAFIYRGWKIYPESFSDFLETGVWQHERNDFYKNPKRLLKFLVNATFRHKEQQHLEHALVFTDTALRGYYQWLGECLPRLVYALDAGYEGTYLLPWVEGSHYIKDAMELLNIPYVEVALDAFVSVDQLTFSPRQAGFHYANPHCLRRVRERLHEALFSEGVPKPHRLLYVSRNKGEDIPSGNRRGIIGEAKMLDILRARGFEVIQPETLSLKKVIELFSTARCVLGPHGAGIANILFMQHGGSVFEVGNRLSTPVTYCQMADNLGLGYYYYFADETSGVEDGRGAHCWNLRVQYDAFERELDAMLESL